MEFYGFANNTAIERAVLRDLRWFLKSEVPIRNGKVVNLTYSVWKCK